MELRTRSSTRSEDDEEPDVVYSQMKESGWKRLFAGWNTKEFIGELLGTMFLMIIGNCSAAVYCVKKPQEHATMPLAYIGGIAAMTGILVSLPISGGHINPTVTIAFAACKRMEWNKVFHYLLGQYIGSFLAQCIVWALFHEHIDKYDGGMRSAYGDPLSTGKIFTTFPPGDASLLTCIFDQVLCAWVLLVAVCAIIDQRGMKIPVFLQPFIISVFIAAMGSAMGFNAGGINPARDLSPRVFTMIAGYGVQAFSPQGGHYWYAVGVIAPHVGALLGVITFDNLIGRYLPEEEPDEAAETKRRISRYPHRESLAYGLLSSPFPAGRVSWGPRLNTRRQTTPDHMSTLNHRIDPINDSGNVRV